MASPSSHATKIILSWALLVAVQLACTRSWEADPGAWRVSGMSTTKPPTATQPATALPFLPPTRQPGVPILSPTPDQPHPLPSLRARILEHVVTSGDTLNQIAQMYGVSPEVISQANELPNPDYLDVGQVLTIPASSPGPTGPDFKIIPDSELVYGPASAGFDSVAFIQNQAGYLTSYSEDIDDQKLSGAEIVDRVAQEFSVNPRLLLAVLEYQSEWVSNPEPKEKTLEFPMGWHESRRQGLYRQLAWAADKLNRGYYLWRVNGVAVWILTDGSVVPIPDTLNAGTAGIQHLYSLLYDLPKWEKAVSERGVYATYSQFFGYPFDLAIEPVLPPDLTQPVMQLPFEPDETWSFTGGPHGGWGSGSAWAAIDFAPPGDALGCVTSDAWVVAAADGLIVRVENGAVVEDLASDSPPDGYEQTGWTLLYLHIEKRERVKEGTYVRAGDRLGHPSCEGGISSGTHVHLARRYNGEWIPADQDVPFILDGWISSGTGIEYDGLLTRNGESVEAWEGRSPINEIQR